MAQSAIKSMHQSQTMEVSFHFPLRTLLWWIVVSAVLR